MDEPSIEGEERGTTWCETLEELLQCPVCLEITVGQNVQCLNGHHVCNKCREQLQLCPICKSHFIATRNLAVEQISSQFKEIKLSLLNPYHDLNRRLLKNKVCVATQTENVALHTTACQTETAHESKALVPKDEPKDILSPRVARGTYPCKIGSCIKELAHGRMIGHLRYYHKNIFYEFNKKCTIFKRNWHLGYSWNQDYDFALYIKGMGLFFLNVTIYANGDLTAIVQIVNCNEAGKDFTYSLETGYGPYKRRYFGAIKSCRAQRESFSGDCLRIRYDHMRRIVDNRNSFSCSLMIKRKIDCRTTDDEHEATELDLVSF